MTSTILQAAEAFTDTTIAKLTRSPLINAGSLFMFDLTDGYCNPNPVGVLAAGAVLRNLVEGQPNAVMVAGAGNPVPMPQVTVASGHSGVLSTSQTGNVVSVPQIKLSEALNTGDKPLMWSLWYKPDAENPSNPNQAFMIDQSSDSGFRKWSLYSGGYGDDPYLVQRAGGAGFSTPPSPRGQDNGVVTQLAASWVNGTLSMYRNGVLVATAGGISPAAMADSTGGVPAFNFFKKGKYFQYYLERLDLSGRTALQAVQADYELNKTRFS